MNTQQHRKFPLRLLEMSREDRKSQKRWQPTNNDKCLCRNKIKSIEKVKRKKFAPETKTTAIKLTFSLVKRNPKHSFYPTQRTHTNTRTQTAHKMFYIEYESYDDGGQIGKREEHKKSSIRNICNNNNIVATAADNSISIIRPSKFWTVSEMHTHTAQCLCRSLSHRILSITGSEAVPSRERPKHK